MCPVDKRRSADKLMKNQLLASLLSWLLQPDYTSSSSTLTPADGVAPAAIAFTETENAAYAKLRVEVSTHITFLRMIHTTGVTLTKPSNESIRRCVNLWLPLVVELQQQHQASHHPVIMLIIQPSFVTS